MGIEKVVEVPQVQVVEKVVPVPQVIVEEVVRQVPRVMVQEVVRQVPRVQVQEVVRQVAAPAPVVVAAPQSVITEVIAPTYAAPVTTMAAPITTMAAPMTTYGTSTFAAAPVVETIAPAYSGIPMATPIA